MRAGSAWIRGRFSTISTLRPCVWSLVAVCGDGWRKAALDDVNRVEARIQRLEELIERLVIRSDLAQRRRDAAPVRRLGSPAGCGPKGGDVELDQAQHPFHRAHGTA